MTIVPDALDAEAPVPLAGSAALSMAKLAASLVLIVAVAALVCCGFALFATLVTVAEVGRDGVSDLLQRLQFDAPLKAKLGVAVVGAVYLGLAVATMVVAVASAKGGWRKRLALGRSARLDLGAFAIMASTILYGAAATYALASTQVRHLTVSGPTDLLLIGEVVCNLCLFAPLAEELLFRGWLYTGLRMRLGVVPSFLVTVALFAAIHLSRRHILLVIPLALALGLLRIITDSIRPTMVLHGAYNLVVIVVTLANV